MQRGAVTRNAKQKYSRLIGKLANKKRNLVFGEDTPARKVMQQAVTYLKENLKQTDIQITRLMMDLELKDEYGVEVQREERTKCSQYLSETITNMTLHFNDKSKRQRYSSHMINLSLVLYLRNKSSYDTIRSSGFMNLPHPNTVKKITKAMKIQPGYDPSAYLTMKEIMRKSGKKYKGHIMLDEIKLKNGLAWNCMNNEITGFISEDLNTTKLFEKILGFTLNTKDKNKQMAVYANQWRFESSLRQRLYGMGEK